MSEIRWILRVWAGEITAGRQTYDHPTEAAIRMS
jgi:hypothetical protein